MVNGNCRTRQLVAGLGGWWSGSVMRRVQLGDLNKGRVLGEDICGARLRSSRARVKSSRIETLPGGDPLFNPFSLV